MTDRDKIHYEAVRRVGNSMKGACFELGAEWALGTVTRINDLAKQAHETAVRRGKTSEDALHLDTFFGILSELKEFREASEIDPSEHLPQYTASQEELTDVLICCLTELHRRGVDVERIIKEKIEFNKTRCNR
jgi:NTP pyrophosphatase (non-canonical NTP hydrolase)